MCLEYGRRVVEGEQSDRESWIVDKRYGTGEFLGLQVALPQHYLGQFIVCPCYYLRAETNSQLNVNRLYVSFQQVQADWLDSSTLSPQNLKGKMILSEEGNAPKGSCTTLGDFNIGKTSAVHLIYSSRHKPDSSRGSHARSWILAIPHESTNQGIKYPQGNMSSRRDSLDNLGKKLLQE